MPRTHHSLRGRRTESERYPSRRLSSIGGRTTGWRSSLETDPRQSYRSFVGQLVIATVALVLIVALLVLTSGGS